MAKINHSFPPELQLLTGSSMLRGKLRQEISNTKVGGMSLTYPSMYRFVLVGSWRDSMRRLKLSVSSRLESHDSKEFMEVEGE